MERLCAYNPRINHILHLSYEIGEKTMTTKNTLCFTAAAVIVAFILGGIFLCRQGKGNYAISPQNNVRLPVIMYHSVLKDTSRTGDYIITPDSLEEDMAYLEKNGYTAVSAQQVLDYCKNNGSLPDKPVMITFDDGFLNNLTYALPILEKYHMKGIVNIVGSYCESAVEQGDHNPYYQYLTWKEISALSADGTVEIGAHTYSMHSLDGRKGCSRLEWESVDDYQSLFSEDLSAVTDLLRENCGISPVVFAYPFGFISEESYPILSEYGYEIALTCTERVNYLSQNSEGNEIIILDRFNRSGNYTTEEFMEKLGC